MKKLLSILLSAILLLTSVAALAEDMIPSPEAEAVPATTRIDFADGKFYAQSGKVYTVTGEDQTKNGYDWSVYMKNKNPKTAKVNITNTLIAGIGEYMIFTKETDTFVEADLSNLAVLTDVVEFEGFTCEAGGWSQSGFSMPEEIKAALALALLMLLSMVSIASAEEPRHIVIGTTWDIFYDSTHTDVYDNPDYDPADPEAAAAALDVRDNEEALGWWYGVTAKDIDLQEYNEVMTVPETPKLIALTEVGVVPDIEQMIAANARWLWFNTWGGDYVYSKAKYSEKYTEAELLKKVYDSEYVITLDELPDLD